MAKNKSVEFMTTFVQEYLDGETERYFFDMDLNYYLTQHYPSMERHNADLAECFYFYLAEQGMDCSEGLCDGDHKKLFRKQFEKFMDAWRDGSC